ncbi:hypothetical protein [Alloscardovia criceti]|uniref:hypothetical protein n=1 Tax=Alloscardovia criceti TaxID=356828 RepID=UPI00035EF271|nr:hypothetical protein [Alloscardovia criceti]
MRNTIHEWAKKHKILATLAAIFIILAVWTAYSYIYAAFNSTPTVEQSAQTATVETPKQESVVPDVSNQSNTDKLHSLASQMSKDWTATLQSHPTPVLKETMSEILNIDRAQYVAPMDDVDNNLTVAIQEALHVQGDITDEEYQQYVDNLNQAQAAYDAQMWSGANQVLGVYIMNQTAGDTAMTSLMVEQGGYPDSCMTLAQMQKDFSYDTTKLDQKETFDYMSNWYQDYQKQFTTCENDMTPEQQVATQNPEQAR